MLVSRVVGAHDDREGVRFEASLQATSRLVSAPQGRCANLPTPLVGLLQAVGGGDTNLLGPVVDEQSHCVRDDGTFDGGQFTLTNPTGKKIKGRYCGNLVPTFNSKFGPPPSGTWLIAGNVCIVSVGGRAVSDCNQQCPKGYEPATGITTLPPRLDGPATIFIDQVIRFKQGH